MSDLRQGVTPAGHDAFDLLDALRAQHADLYPCQLRILAAGAMRRADAAQDWRPHVLEAAAYLILAVEQLDLARTGTAG